MRVMQHRSFILVALLVAAAAQPASAQTRQQRQATQRRADIVVAGAGASGAVLAVHLAEKLRLAGKKGKIIIVEAGGDVANRIPMLHAHSADPESKVSRGMNLDYAVQYLHDEAENAQRFNYRRDKGGDLHTRGKGRAGSANHHALFNLFPPKSYWNELAAETGDSSWSAEQMAKHEDVVRRLIPVVNTGVRSSRALGDPRAIATRDPNDERVRANFGEGPLNVPVNTKKFLRWGARELLNQYMKDHPGSIEVVEHTLVDRAVFDSRGRATALKVIRGGRLGADHDPKLPEVEETIEIGKAFVDSTGAFEAPGTMWRSGVGPAAKLRALGIPVVSDVPAGTGLGSRMETPVIGKLNPLKIGKLLVQARSQNGAIDLEARKSDPGLAEADGVRIGLAGGAFKGYNWNYTAGIIQPGVISILDLQAKTRHLGTVEPQSRDPRVAPKINFNMFDPKHDPDGKDLAIAISGFRQALASARKLGVKEVYDHASEGFVKIEHFERMSDAKLGAHIKRVVWDHHPGHSTPIGRPEDPATVVLPSMIAKGTDNYYSISHADFRPIGIFPVRALHAVGVKGAEEIYERFFGTAQAR
jgi:choline dehydrogenase